MAKRKAGKKESKNTVLDIGDFKYLPSNELPKLVLGIKVPLSAFDEDVSSFNYEFAPGKDWHKIAHQTAGMGCHQKYLIGTFLTPKSEFTFGAMKNICDGWLGRNTGIGGTTLREINDYSAKLRLLQACCERSYADLEEGYYPIDIEYVKKFTDDVFPENLDDLIIWRDGFHRAGNSRKFVLAILGKNSD